MYSSLKLEMGQTSSKQVNIYQTVVNLQVQ